MTNSKERRPDDVKKMFARVSSAYDVVNRAMCGGLDILWRKALVRSLLKDSRPSSTFIDIASGSGDVALQILKTDLSAKVVCVDFCPQMLEAARKKFQRENLKNPSLKILARTRFVEADCGKLPFYPSSFDGASIAFGFRNFQDRKACLSEIRRVLTPGSKLFSLEVARAPKFLAPFQLLFMKFFVPIIGVIFGGSYSDYKYLADTTLSYPTNPEVVRIFEESGFTDVSVRPFVFGFVAITSAVA